MTKRELRELLSRFSHDEILEAAAALNIGISPSASRGSAVAGILDWAATPERMQQIAAELRPR